jgi:hypothetical protein
MMDDRSSRQGPWAYGMTMFFLGCQIPGYGTGSTVITNTKNVGNESIVQPSVTLYFSPIPQNF